MRIYTKRGDQGETDTFGGGRISKDAPRVEAYGTVDELNAFIGLVLSELPERQRDLVEVLTAVQSRLFDLGADLATPERRHARASARPVPRISEEMIAEIEAQIDRLQEEVPPMTAFILPGGARPGALLHVARTVCRRAERRAVALSGSEPINPLAVAYLNRLSDLLFVMARAVNRREGQAETEWHSAIGEGQ